MRTHVRAGLSCDDQSLHLIVRPRMQQKMGTLSWRGGGLRGEIAEFRRADELEF